MGVEGLTEDAKAMLGDYRKALIAMTVPLLVSLLIAQANTFIDTFWCSLLGSKSLAAIGVVSSYYCILTGLGSGVGIGVSAVVAAHMARGEKEDADKASVQSLVFMAAIGLLCTPLFFIIGDPILSCVMGDAYQEGVEYARPYYLCAVVLVVQGIMLGILRGEGAAKRAMVVTSMTAVVNMVFDPLFAFSLGMGISGLAWATVTATLLSCIPFVYWYTVRKGTTYVDIKAGYARPERKVLKDVLSIGVPKALELDIMWGLNFICCYFVMICGGSSATAVYTTGWKYVDIIQTPANAMTGALVPIASAAFALKDLAKMRSAYIYALVRALVITSVLAVLLFVMADYAVAILSNSESSRALEAPMSEAIRIYVIVAVLFAAITVASSLLQAMRKAGLSMWSTLLRNIALIGSFAALCTYTPVTMWWGFVGVEVFGLVLMCGLAEHEYRKLWTSRGQVS